MQDNSSNVFRILIMLAENNPRFARIYAEQIIRILSESADIIARELEHLMSCLLHLNQGKYISAYYDYQEYLGDAKHYNPYYAAADNRLFSLN